MSISREALKKRGAVVPAKAGTQVFDEETGPPLSRGRPFYRFTGRLSGLVAALLLALPVAAQQWPAKPVHFIVPFPPGGSVDPLARLLAGKLSESSKSQFIVENKPGASGSIGAAQVAKSPPDGYTFLFVFDTHAVNPSLIPNLPFDTAKDLAPVMLVGTAPMAIATQPAKPYKTFDDVIKAAKAKPDKITFGSIGNGSLGHLTMILVQQAAGIKLVHVPYKGGGPMTTDAIGGQVDLAVGSVAVISPHVKNGRLRAVAVTGDKRSQAMPDVPALAEQGFKGFSALAWWGIFAPAGTPKPILDKFHGDLVKTLKSPDVRKTLTDTLGMDLVVSSPDELQKFLLGEMQRWGKVVKDNHIKPD
jgi:tripartite-type tricarboxylate transporter receptor subunit TctC